MMNQPMARRVMGASRGHGSVGAFYAPQAGEGKHILRDELSTSVETIRRDTGPRRIGSGAMTGPERCRWRPLAGPRGMPTVQWLPSLEMDEKTLPGVSQRGSPAGSKGRGDGTSPCPREGCVALLYVALASRRPVHPAVHGRGSARCFARSVAAGRAPAYSWFKRLQGISSV